MFALRAGLPFRWSFTSSTYINGMRLLSSAAKAANPPNHTVYLRCQHPSKDTILTVSQVRDKASSYGQVQRIDLGTPLLYPVWSSSELGWQLGPRPPRLYSLLRLRKLQSSMKRTQTLLSPILTPFRYM